MTTDATAHIDRPPDAEGVLPIWPDDCLPPDTRDWERREQISRLPDGTRIARNVAIPSLTVFRPKDDTSNGTSVVVAPGGAFHFLAIDHEGYDVARWLTHRGVTAFVLKYRVQATPVDDDAMPAFLQRLSRDLPPVARSTTEPPQSYAPAQEARRWAEADIGQAIRYLRQNAGTLGIAWDRIGLIGFSAGGAGVNVAVASDRDTRPDFIAGIYPGWRRPLDVPGDAPPLFIAVGDDDMAVAPVSAARLYEAWHFAGAPVELHVFAATEHAFGMSGRETPARAWGDLFATWLTTRGLL